MTSPGPRVAANPIPYWVVGSVVNKSREVFEQAYRDISAIGFSAVKVDIPEGMSSAEYKEWLDGYELAPALSNFVGTFDQREDPAEVAERARTFARQQLDMGIDTTMLTARMIPQRLAAPAVGAAFHAGRLEAVINRMAALCEVFRHEGIHPLLHPHVGGWVETEREVRAVLDSIDADLLGFGPDTGHMRWAGMDPASLIRDYRDRVRAIHVKDAFPDFLDGRDTGGRGYFELTGTRRLWAEPGLGVVDFDEVVAAMPDGFRGDYMIEVDVPSVESNVESLRMSFDWAQRALSFATL
jgi:inosose dehydratase